MSTDTPAPESDYEQDLYKTRAATRRQDARDAAPVPPPVKVGEQLAFRDNYNGWSLSRVERITKSGRIVMEDGRTTLNPDLTVRGRDTWSTQARRAERVTPEIRAAVKRQRQLVRLLHLTKWNELPDSVLSAVCAALDAAALASPSDAQA